MAAAPMFSPASRGAALALAKNLNLKPGMKMHVIGKPGDVDLGDVDLGDVDLGDVETTTAASADAVLIFVKTLAEVGAKCGPAVQAAKADRLSEIAYPKGGQLGTDLNRDILWRHLLKEEKIQGVRQVAIDDVWSALRFRPAK
jgi:hypothetical protein